MDNPKLHQLSRCYQCKMEMKVARFAKDENAKVILANMT